MTIDPLDALEALRRYIDPAAFSGTLPLEEAYARQGAACAKANELVASMQALRSPPLEVDRER